MQNTWGAATEQKKMKTSQPTIGELLQHWARSTPASVALVAPGRKPLTYDAYGRQAEYVRETLSNWGIGRGDRVALVLPTGAEAGVCYVSVCSCATAAPLNPAYTFQEFSLYLERLSIKAAIVLHGNDTAARAVAANLGILLIELNPDYSGPAGTFQLSGGAPATPRRSGLPSADDLALVVQTSGTTSRSKIIPLTHLNVVERAMLENSFFGIGSKDRVLCLNTLYHHSGLKQGVIEPLQSGGSTVGISAFGPADLLELLEEFKPTWCTGAATFFHEIVRIAGSRNADFRRHSLRYFRSGSAPLLPSVANAIEETFGVPILNAYSSSEAGTMTSNPPPPGVQRSETVGIPIGIDVSILDDDGNELPPGEPGEVAARGPTVMHGYEDDSEANAQSFCNGWFRTSDAGYFDQSGYLVLTGRLKEVINRGGEKISPAEVEAALIAHPDVIEAATFPVPHPSLGEFPAAAVVLKAGARVSEEALVRFLRERLADFKVPARLVFLDEIPKSAAGKIQRGQLARVLGIDRMIGDQLHQDTAKGREPTEREYRLQRLWKKALRIEHVGLNDNFFMLGGDSLQAVELFLEIEKEFNHRLPTAALFEAVTVAEISALIEEGEMPGCMVPIQPDGTHSPFFCVHPIHGDVISFYDLAKHLGPDQPFYGIQPVGWDRSTPPFIKTADMAAHYVSEMRKIQPHGPYYLGGYFFGGRIAVYMANILKEAGEEVALLAMIASYNLAGRLYVSFGQWLDRIGWPPGHGRVGQWLDRIGAPPGPGLIWLALRYAWCRINMASVELYERGRRLVLTLVHEWYRATGKSIPLFLCRPDRCNMLMRFEHFHMPTYDGDAVYFRAEIDKYSMLHADAHDTWSRIIKGRLDTIPVTGINDQIMKEPHVKLLAEKLALELARARKK